MQLSLAPMLKVTTPSFRRLIHSISPKVLLFTEMIVSNTVNNVTDEKLEYLLGPPNEQTVVQIGGSDPQNISLAIRRLVLKGFLKFNLNCGCPSDRVQKGCFGAILMLKKELVAEIINLTNLETGIILSLKIRTGVDENDSCEFFSDFVKYISENTKCKDFYVHARKCWLKGLSPKHNRNIPPLKYEFVYQIKSENPQCNFYLNGGIKDFSMIGNLDGLMIGRHAVENIFIFNDNNVEKNRIKEYLENSINSKYSRFQILSPLNNLQKGKPRNKEFKRVLNCLIQSDCSFLEIFGEIQDYI